MSSDSSQQMSKEAAMAAIMADMAYSCPKPDKDNTKQTSKDRLNAALHKY